MHWFSSAPSVILLVLGFGFVIFFHELGHFLAAKWVGIRVEQFAVGFGQALVSWRKGMGFTFGSSGRKLEELKRQQDAGVAGIDVARFGETEYRLNWIPLGGYVKMLGQDDLNPNAAVDDPRAFNRKSVGARMLVVSAGVIMNVILAAIGFMILFTIGFNAPPPVVGQVKPDSPAQRAGLLPGDRILYYDGTYQHDYTKIRLNVALSHPGWPVPIYVQHPDGSDAHLTITPEPSSDLGGLLDIGIDQPVELRGADRKDASVFESLPRDLNNPDRFAIRPGDTVVAINGMPVDYKTDAWKLDRAVQASYGRPVELTVKGDDGSTRNVALHPQFVAPFDSDPLNFAGMQPRPQVDSLLEDSSAKGKLLPGDVFVAVSDSTGRKSNPTARELTDWLDEAGRNGRKVDLNMLRDGSVLSFTGLSPDVRVGHGRWGLGVGLSFDSHQAVVANVLDKSPAQQAGLGKGSVIRQIDEQPVQTWFDVFRLLSAATPGQSVSIQATTEGGQARTFHLVLDEQQLQLVRDNRPEVVPILHVLVQPRKAPNILIAAAWGVGETRDFILQFYLTLRRMVQGSISYTNMMGPVGIFAAGTKFADMGTDWLIWFLAMISANLAVVNFLPIPIVDGGLFTFLIVEKIQGRPLSARTQSIAQVIGLALLVSVVLLVTYQDIARLVLR